MNNKPELLLPAGDYASFQAAITNGANAVYLGVAELNARRRAENFTIEQLPKLVEEAHSKDVKIYLTLNIDLRERELRKAATLLQAACEAGIDAVLIRDPALLALRQYVPQLDFHFSTQACISSTADTMAAKELGISRVVLARECSIKEIKEIAEVGVEVETFVQGALCYSVSGRCQLSSWGGGRSGNRGCCTSPCRVPWGINEAPTAGTPLSMVDLGLIDNLKQLTEAGVCSLKIEGRLKTDKWVAKATKLYREALDSDIEMPRQHLAAELGDYTGRPLSSAYLDGEYERLTGTWERNGSSSVGYTEEQSGTEEAKITEETEQQVSKTYDFQIMEHEDGLRCTCTIDKDILEWDIPISDIRRPEKAVTIFNYFEFLKQNAILDYTLKRCRTTNKNQLLAPRAINNLSEKITTFIRKKLKEEKKKSQAVIDLSPEIKTMLIKEQPYKTNTQTINSKANTVRILAKFAEEFATNIKGVRIIAEQATPELIAKWQNSELRKRIIISLPAVFFNEQLPQINAIVAAAKEGKFTMEINSWGGWHLVRKAGLPIHAGPGMSVYNSLAAKELNKLGCLSVNLSIESDRELLEDLSRNTAVPTTLTVYGRIPLMYSRANQPKELLGKIWQDRRDLHIIPRNENGLLVYRSAEPFSIMAEKDQDIKVTYVVYDLISEPNPLKTWERLTASKPIKSRFTFNFNRKLN